MRFLVFLSIVFTSSIVIAQKNVSINILCKDAENLDEIYNAAIEIIQNETAYFGKTNKKGECTFDLPNDSDITIKIQHEYYGVYYHQTYVLSNQVNPVFPLSVQIFLSSKVQNIEPITIIPSGKVEVAYQSKELSVSDFDFLPNGELVLLLYPKTMKKGSELGVLSNNKLKKTYQFREKPIELIHDFRGNVHVVCDRGVYGIHITSDGLSISTLEKDYFFKYIFPIIDTSYSKYYFSNFNKNYPAFDYKTYDQLDSTYSLITEIKDELMMELYRSEYKWVDVRTKLWAKNLELKTGIDKEIWVGANYFTQSIYYKELYAPMFKKNDSIFVFDYYKDQLFTFNLNGQKIDSVSIFHHYHPKKTGWKKNLMQDKETGKIYAFFEKDGICSLKLVNTKSGMLESTIVFEHHYIDKIAINGNYAYYIYRPFESAQKKFLYKVKLP